MDVAALILTLKLAAATTLLLCLIGLPLGYWLATSRHRARPLVEALLTLPLILPPTVVGYYLLAATAPQTWLGEFYSGLFGSQLAFSFGGLLIGSLLYNLPIALRPTTAAISAVDRKLLEAAKCLGDSPLRTLTRVVLPLSWPGIAAGAVLTFAHTVGEFGIVLMLGGNIPGVTRTLSIAIYDDVQAMNYDSAGRTAASLLAFAFAALALVHFLQRRRP